MKYTTLYFDVDNTLLDFTASEAYAIRELFKSFGLPYDDKTVSLYSDINNGYWKLYESGSMTRDEILVARFKDTLKLLSSDIDPVKINNRYLGILSECHFAVEGAKEVLCCLKQKGYIILATTNGLIKTQFKRIEQSGLSVYMDGVFVSETVGFQKPSREYYQFVMANSTEKDKSKILIIGDSMTSDIKGGINMGIDTCWYDAKGEKRIFEPTYTVKNIKELNSIL